MNEAIKGIVNDLRMEMKERDKESRMDYVMYNIYEIADYYATRSFSFKNKELTESLLSVIDNVKFAKALLKVVENEPETIPATIVLLLTRFVDDKLAANPDILELVEDEDGNKSIEVKDKVVLLYSTVNDKILKKPAKVLSHDTGINKQLAISILTVVPDREMITKDHLVRIYTSNVNRAIFNYYKKNQVNMDDLITADQLRKVYKHVFGKENMEHVYRALATESSQLHLHATGDKTPTKEVKMVNDMVQHVLGNHLESSKKKEIRAFVEDFRKSIERDKKKGKVYTRRLDVLSSKEFPKTYSILTEELTKASDEEDED